MRRLPGTMNALGRNATGRLGGNARLIPHAAAVISSGAAIPPHLCGEKRTRSLCALHKQKTRRGGSFVQRFWSLLTVPARRGKDQDPEALRVGYVILAKVDDDVKSVLVTDAASMPTRSIGIRLLLKHPAYLAQYYQNALRVIGKSGNWKR